jgi:hypothetical protein
MSFMQYWRYALSLPLAATGRVSLTVCLRKEEAEALAEFLDYFDWGPNPRTQGRYEAMRSAGARIRTKLRSLGFDPPPYVGFWAAIRHLQPPVVQPPAPGGGPQPKPVS